MRVNVAFDTALHAAGSIFKRREPQIDRLREKGFGAVWGKIGRGLAAQNGRLDAYFRGTRRYAAMSNLWARLKTAETGIRDAKSILDVTAMNGTMAKHILSTAEGDCALYANEIADGMQKRLKTNLAEYIGGKQDEKGLKKAIPVSIDLSDRADTAGFTATHGKVDAILWLGSFQISAGRHRAIANAFDMLTEGGHLVIMDVYPKEETTLAQYVGSDIARKIAVLGKPLDMGEDVGGLIYKGWMERMGETSETRGEVTIRHFNENLQRSPGFADMRCIYARKPLRNTTPVAQHDERHKGSAVFSLQHSRREAAMV